jgi:SpoVK/Ycf46/Vps4 family AAA+-type ATPase
MVQPDTKIVVFMEDLDALLERKESVTLNMLDGAEDLQRVVFVATTNYPEKLGPRVQNRPSRFDRRFKIPHPSPVARQMYLEKVVSAGSAKIDIERYVRDSDGFSLAHLKELFVATVLIGAPYEKAVASLREMIEETASSVYDTTDPATVRRGQYA